MIMLLTSMQICWWFGWKRVIALVGPFLSSIPFSRNILIQYVHPFIFDVFHLSGMFVWFSSHISLRCFKRRDVLSQEKQISCRENGVCNDWVWKRVLILTSSFRSLCHVLILRHKKSERRSVCFLFSCVWKMRCRKDVRELQRESLPRLESW